MSDPQVSMGTLEDKVHRLHQRVYWAETDIGGVVHHANFIVYMERGRSEFLRALELDQQSLARDLPDETLIWIIRHLEADYRKSAFLDDVITIETALGDVKGASIRMDQVIRRGDEVLMRGHVKAAFVDENGRPKRLPKHMREKIGAYVVDTDI